MNNLEVKAIENPATIKSQKYSMFAQILLRILATAFTLTATCIILTSKETVTVFTIEMEARYSYSPALKFFASANVIGCFFPFGRKGLHLNKYFYLFVHDMIMMGLLVGGCASATTIGYVGKYGESHSGWMPICDYSLGKFSYFGVIALLSSRQINLE